MLAHNALPRGRQARVKVLLDVLCDLPVVVRPVSREGLNGKRHGHLDEVLRHVQRLHLHTNLASRRLRRAPRAIDELERRILLFSRRRPHVAASSHAVARFEVRVRFHERLHPRAPHELERAIRTPRVELGIALLLGEGGA